MKRQVCYHTAIYLRLSRDDEDIDGGKKRESESIAAQRELARSFVEAQEDMELFDIYIDDGYSGVNFNRPDFKRMLADIEAGRVNCVVVKDLSRFGRDYIEAGRFIQKIFPAFSVRFIAITDRYDSLTADRNTTSLVIPVKNFVNDAYCQDISGKVKSHQRVKREMGRFIGAFAVYGYRKDEAVIPVKNFVNDAYCQDISGKVKSHQRVKREMGRFIGAFAVYGYRKDEADKNRLVVDAYAACIVRHIFAWKLEGMSSLAIAKRLNENGIFSPLAYKREHGEHYATGFRTGIVSKWSSVTVKRILTNEIYTGTMVQGRSEKVSYKVDKVLKKPEDEWIKVPGTHEAIICREDFLKVQRLLQVDTRAGKGKETPHMFAGLLFCGDCKEPMIRRVNRYKGREKIYYICSTRNRSEGCTRHSIAEEDLKRAVFEVIRIQMLLLTDKDSRLGYSSIREGDLSEAAGIAEEIVRLRREQEKYPKLRAALYEDFKEGVITEEDFLCFGKIYEMQYRERERALVGQEEMRKQMLRKGAQSGLKLERMRETLQPADLDREILLAFVERIEVCEDKRILIQLSYREAWEWQETLADLFSVQQKDGRGAF